ncbi:putative N-acetyltransferase YhhY [Saliniradius amylolyticus]|uniref:Putative N-acetyltransferase YhhY n=1 Tax=Saliniradius amylolyticus TaxID=2183582 RepID=A0A2S2E2Y1_9ALTE|nr:GNAT family N-acetyltransferase [Saliniradius amylolyticus]AWL11998.1 putative N-acetyltransferase YhhY [Saliniradius amylolyticus]
MEFNIRHLEKSDAESLADTYRFTEVTEQTSQLPYMSSETVSDLFFSTRNYTLVAEQGGRIMGHVSLFLSDKARERHCASLAIAIHPDAQGKGLGRRLMHSMLEQADNWLNLVRIELEVHSDNKPAIELYKKYDFEIEGEKRFATFKRGQYHNLLIMARLRKEDRERERRAC